MKNLKTYNGFINEAKKENPKKENPKKENPKKENKSIFEKDVKDLFGDLFVKLKNFKFEYDKDGYPKSATFGVVENDFFDYNKNISPEMPIGILKKRDYDFTISFEDKWTEKEKNEIIHMMEFSIDKIKINDGYLKEFDKKTKDEDDDEKVNSKDENWYSNKED